MEAELKKHNEAEAAELVKRLAKAFEQAPKDMKSIFYKMQNCTPHNVRLVIKEGRKDPEIPREMLENLKKAGEVYLADIKKRNTKIQSV